MEVKFMEFSTESFQNISLFEMHSECNASQRNACVQFKSSGEKNEQILKEYLSSIQVHSNEMK